MYVIMLCFSLSLFLSFSLSLLLLSPWFSLPSKHHAQGYFLAPLEDVCCMPCLLWHLSRLFCFMSTLSRLCLPHLHSHSVCSRLGFHYPLNTMLKDTFWHPLSILPCLFASCLLSRHALTLCLSHLHSPLSALDLFFTTL
jgi:hypothetical protein